LPTTKNILNPGSHEDEIPNMHNVSRSKQPMFRDDVLYFLSSRKGKLEGVVITGGEPTLYKGLPEFIREIKDMGFAVKLDTNGTNPKMLQKLLDEKLVDYVAMDIKAPIGLYSKSELNQKSRLGLLTQQHKSNIDLNTSRYEQVVCAKVNTKNILKSIEILKNSDIKYEFRTTVVKSQLNIEDFEKIGEIIEGVPKYYLQRFMPTKTLDESFMQETTYSDEEFELIIKVLKKYIKHVELR